MNMPNMNISDNAWICLPEIRYETAIRDDNIVAPHKTSSILVEKFIGSLCFMRISHKYQYEVSRALNWNKTVINGRLYEKYFRGFLLWEGTA